MENEHPNDTANRNNRDGGSRRSGRELISTAVPPATHAENTAAASNSDSGRPLPTTNRPVQCPSTSTCGLDTALSNRAVIAAAGIRNLECTLATTTSTRDSNSTD